MKKIIMSLLGAAALTLFASSAIAGGHKSAAAPTTVIHVVTVSWNDDATEAQIQAALDGVHTLTEEYEGITRAWTKTIKAQGNRSHAFVMEFKSEKALKDYAGSDAQKNWYKVYIDARKASTTFDITN